MFGNRLGWGISVLLAALMLFVVFQLGKISQIQKPSHGVVMRTGNVVLELESRPQLLDPIQLPFEPQAIMPERVDPVDVSSLYDEAIAEYHKAEKDKGLDAVLAREGLGIALETKALAEKDPAAQQRLLGESLEAFLRMQPDDTGPRRAYALYHQGRINLQLQKKAEAKALFEKVKGMNPPKELADLVERRLSES